MEKSYLKIYFSTLLLGSIIVIALNWIINPYSLYDSPVIEKLNKEKTEYLKYLRLTKPRIITKHQSNSIILGTSRAGRGLSPNHPAWGNDKVYNLALPGVRIYEILRYLQHAQASQPLNKVVLALDFRSFTNEIPNSAFSENRLLVKSNGEPNNKYYETYFFDSMSTLFSIDALGSSLKTIRKQGWDKETLFPNGRWDRTDENVNHRKIFTAYTNSTIQRLNEIILNKLNRPSGFQHFRDLLSLSYKENIQLIMLISPSHAWHWEVYRLLKLQKNLDNLKRLLVSINNEEAEKSGRAAYPIWDFSGHNSISIESLPLQNEKDGKMRWFWESIHYKKRLGDMILDRILKNQSPKKEIPIDFGQQLTSSNIETHISYLKQQSDSYQQNHPDDIAILQALIYSTAQVDMSTP